MSKSKREPDLSLWAISGNFWLPDNLLEDSTAAGITRGVLLYSQANYFAARACIQLAGGFSHLCLNPLSDRFKEQARNGGVPGRGEVRKYLLAAVEPLKNVPDRFGATVVGPTRDLVIHNISEYVELIEQATPLRNAICHGVLTKDDQSQLALHPTNGEGPSVLWEEVPRFLVLCHNAYAAASTVSMNLGVLASHG